MSRRIGALLLVLAALCAAGAARAEEEGEAAARPRYGSTPEDLVPFRRMGEPDRTFFTEAPTFRGPGAEDAEPDVAHVALGAIAPLGGIDAPLGRRMLAGIRLALEEANAAGGHGGVRPYVLHVRDENDVWGAAGNALVDLWTKEGVWAVLGALEDENSHVMTRLLLKLELPMVNAGGPDPTLTEHMIPWLVRMRPDDRQTCYRLVQRIVREDGHRRVAIFRSNDRYGRTGTREFVDASRRLHQPILLEVRFPDAEADLSSRIDRLRAARPDAIVLWGRAGPAGRALRALRAAGLEQPVYGPDRLCDPAFLAAAGAAAEGLVFTYPFDPTGDLPAWKAFVARYEARFGETPDAVAAYAYDATRYLVQAIAEGGINRPRIREALFSHPTFEGVMGTIRFDVTHNNVNPMILGKVVGGAFVFGE